MKASYAALRLLLGWLAVWTILLSAASPLWAAAPLPVVQAETSETAESPANPPDGQTPVRLVIPKLRLDATIEAGGKTDDGALAVPQAFQNVIWYDLGIKPGERGNAVISGHLDSKAGRAVFWRLRDLQVGDTLSVFDQSGAERTFVVVERATYAYDQAPLTKIFGFDLERDLNLITCTGRWNKKLQTYDQRLVIYTRLAQ